MTGDSAPIVVQPGELGDVSWARRADVLVVGSGAAGCLAALAASRAGGSVVVLEKAAQPGGITSRGGSFWIPNNRLLRDMGKPDDKQRLLAYMARVSWPDQFSQSAPLLGLSELAHRKLETFYDNASPMLDALVDEEQAFELAFSETWDGELAPDYHVGPAQVSDHRGHGVRASDASGGRRNLISALLPVLAKRGIAVLLEHQVRRLIQLPDTTVVGVEVDTPWGTRRMLAQRGVVFGSGGFTRNPELSRQLLVAPLAGARGGVPENEGDFITLAMASGIQLAGVERVFGGLIPFELTVFGGAEESRAVAIRQEDWGVCAGDSMLQVNRYGQRVINEKTNGDNHVEHHWRDPATGERPNLLTFQIHDRRTAELFPYTAEAPHIVKAETLSELTRELSRRLRAVRDYTDDFTLDDSFESGLRASIERFNQFARSGVDEDFGRGTSAMDRLNHYGVHWKLCLDEGTRTGRTQAECLADFRERVVPALNNPYPDPTMHPLADQGPYYAIILAPNPVDTVGGPAVDAIGQVQAAAGGVVPRLFGAGSCVYGPSNGGYWGGGMAIGLAMTTGWLAGAAAMQAQPLELEVAPVTR